MPIIPGTANPETLFGTIDADTMLGLGGDDALYGYDNDDLVDGGDGDDFLYGGSGNDLLIGGAGEDFFFGQSGIDTASYATAAAGMTLDLVNTAQSTGDAHGDFFFSVERYLLGGFDDLFVGSALGDDAAGGAGNDSLFGGAGADTLAGDSGNDTLAGGQGGDTLMGGSGTDLASYATATAGMTINLTAPSSSTGDASGDVYVSIEGFVLTDFSDLLLLDGDFHIGFGGAGNDSMDGGIGADTLLGQAGNDVLSGGNGRDVLDGGDGDDRLFGGASADIFIGGDGDDTVTYLNTVKLDLTTPANGTGEAKGDTFSGIESVSFLTGGSVYVGGATAMNVTLLGTDMTCIAGTGAEHFQAMGGVMTVSYATATSAVTLTGLGGTVFGSGAAAGDSLAAVDTVILTDFADTLNMSNFFAVLPTTFLAGNGNDSLTLNFGFATLVDGGAGKDSIGGVMNAGEIRGGAGNDTVDLVGSGFSNGAVIVSGGSGADNVTLAGYGQATVDLGSGNDVLDIDIGSFGLFAMVDGGSGNDSITGSAASCDLDGGDGNDSLILEAGITIGSLFRMLGGAGDDDIGLSVIGASGFAAAAILNGGLGNDTLSKSALLSDNMATTFVFDAGWGDDTVTGFLDGVDLVDLHTTGATAFADLIIGGDASQTTIGFGADSIVLLGFDVANFGASDVVFS